MTKQKIVGLFIIACLFFFPKNVLAATVSVRGTSAKASVGGSVSVKITLNESKGLGAWEFSVNYDSSKLQLTSGNAHVVDYVQGAGQNSKTYTYTFKVKAPGTASVSVVNTSIGAWDETITSPTDSTTIECVSRQEVEANYSKNNNLKSLEVEGQTLSFDKNTTTYQLEVDAKTTNIKINAQAEDKKASVTGAGEFDVHEGGNEFRVVVTAENGSSKTYTLQVTVKELNPVTVKIDKKNYTVVRKSDELKEILPNHVEETILKIGEEEVLAYKNEVLKLTLVALKDDKGTISFYSYKDGKYTKYQELNGGTLTIHLLTDEKKIPNSFKSYIIAINDETYSVYQLKKDSDYFLVYGENVETGKKSLYLYDKVDKTIQRYYQENIEPFEENIKTKSYMIVGLISVIVILLGSFLIILRTKKKPKKIKQTKKEAKEFLK